MGSANQCGPSGAVFRDDVRVRAVIEQVLHDGQEAVRRGKHQRSATQPVGGIHIGTRLDQRRHRLHTPFGRSDHQRRPAGAPRVCGSVYRLVDIDLHLDQPVDQIGPSCRRGLEGQRLAGLLELVVNLPHALLARFATRLLLTATGDDLAHHTRHELRSLFFTSLLLEFVRVHRYAGSVEHRVPLRARGLRLRPRRHDTCKVQGK